MSAATNAQRNAELAERHARLQAAIDAIVRDAIDAFKDRHGK